MTQRDQLKIMNEGFTIIRADLFRLLIKFKTKKAVLDKMEELLKSPIHIED